MQQDTSPLFRPARPEELPRFHDLVNELYAPLKFSQIERIYERTPEFVLVGEEQLQQTAMLLGPWRTGAGTGAIFMLAVPTKDRVRSVAFALSTLRYAGFKRCLSPLLMREEVPFFRKLGFVRVDDLYFYKYSKLKAWVQIVQRPVKDDAEADREEGPSIRGLGPGDLPSVADIDAAGFTGLWAYGAPDISEILQYSEGLVCVDPDGTVTGSIIFNSSGDSGVIVRIAVRPDKRRAGAGSLLLRSAVDHLIKRNVRNITLCTQSDNSGAHSFYHSNGFKRTSGTATLMDIEV